ncbi:hypothetical protein NL676_000010 [Syzygium grande]|nr:hypothetical protein NL676_000010 [Syzygium grande]
MMATLTTATAAVASSSSVAIRLFRAHKPSRVPHRDPVCSSPKGPTISQPNRVRLPQVASLSPHSTSLYRALYVAASTGVSTVVPSTTSEPLSTGHRWQRKAGSKEQL